MQVTADHLRRFPLHERHEECRAKWGAFGEWEVPLYYSSILREHEKVRTAAGLFDISHMGEFLIEGAEALEWLEGIMPRKVAPMPKGKALYMPLLHETGGIVDDVILYRQAEDRFLLIVNAGNVAKDFEWLRARLPGRGVELADASPGLGLLALQGPLSREILSAALGDDNTDLKYYHFRPWGERGMISRTGYTGEYGYEIMVPAELMQDLWDRLFAAGESFGLVPVGFGARDTLRLEAGMPLYGHDLRDDVNPLEAGLDWAIDFDKEDFTGKEALEKIKAQGLARRLVGFEMLERGIAREGQPIRVDGENAGVVTSGSFSPTLQKNIGLGFVPAGAAAEGRKIEIVIREKPVQAHIVKLPFYSRAK